ncbi:hypothetical protein ACJ73_02446 [Blastomyces percursus]|uniref:Uncharacterized protein n=1 Tax=Blastomyces percursus TaxID=1658174 RepID=A0A1J9RDU3_9EURO|nr:hypothetical protein ACJ73_02446 [Blastomyces percursus]
MQPLNRPPQRSRRATVVSYATYAIINRLFNRITPRVYLDHRFENPFSVTSREIGPSDQLIFRRVINKEISDVRPLNLTTPCRGRLEIETYGLQQLIHTFTSMKCLSLPYQLFIDGFGLYRNVYRSLMGIYLIPACLTAAQRAKRTHVYLIPLGPHGSKFTDVISSLKELSALDQGIEIDIKGTKTRVVAFASMFLGDMPQQQNNAGFKRQNATRGCRQCDIIDVNRGDLEYDIGSHGRYHHQIKHMREKAATLPKSTRDRFLSKWGMMSGPSPLLSIAPSIDVIQSFPADPCHSEYAGMSKIMHLLLLESILSPRGRDEYLHALQTFPFPSGWGRLQSPLHHVESYQLREHARASIILALLLRCYLRDQWINPNFLMAMNETFSDNDSGQKHKVDIVVSAFAAVAKSNSVLTSRRITPEDEWNLKGIILDGRQKIQALLETASIASDPCSRSVSRARSLCQFIQAQGVTAVILQLCPLSRFFQHLVNNVNNRKKVKDIKTSKDARTCTLEYTTLK